MNWVDLVLLALVALSAVQGMRLGATMQVFSFGGFWLGLFVGALIVPHVMRFAHGNVSRALVAAVVIFGTAGILSTAGRYIGARSSHALQRVKLGPADSVLGVAVAVVATLFIAWFTALVIENSNFTSLNAAIQQSRIVRAMDNLLPAPPTILARVKSFLASEGFPVVFAGLSPQASAPVTLPADSQVRAAVLSAGPSTLQVEGEGCGVIQEGSSFVVAPGLVVTNAHVVAGVHHIQVLDNGRSRDAVPIWFDPELDVAVLRVPGLDEPPLSVDTRTFSRGTSGVVLGYPGGGPFTYSPAGITNTFDATGLDIYGTSSTTRAVYELQAVVRPGNSGGPLVASADGSSPANGTVIGLVFARSTTNPEVGYALAMGQVMVDVGRAEHANSPVGTGNCTS
ncbi:MAG TPA: MarP family serine protease [Acidimicrobiales bacterium]|nr:MarP family serine protease [Acidimicrobiales bacterium]